MGHSRERLAWGILIAAFLAFCSLLVSIPLGTRWYLQNAQVALTARLTTLNGTVAVTRPGLPTMAVTGAENRIPEGSVITTDSASEGNLEFLDPGSGEMLGVLQIHNNSDLRLRFLRSPRFQLSRLNHRIVVDLRAGRVGARVALDVTRPVDLTIETPHGLAIFTRAGSYTIEVTADETTVVVREGSATVTAQNRAVFLDDVKDQRTIIRQGQPPLDGLPAERNLVESGDFAAGLQPAWTPRTQKEVKDQVDPEITVITSAGQRAVLFSRPGVQLNWAYAGIRQEIHRDVRELSSLRLHLAVQIRDQDLFNCGAYGTECPLMVKLIYEDRSGGTHEWVKGFFANPDPSGRIPQVCVTCPPPDSGGHELAPIGSWRTYDSLNLIEVFNQAGLPAASISAIEIYASGHAFVSLVSEVELLAQE